MWAWFLVFFAAVATDGKAAAYATFAVIGAGAVGCWVGGVLGDRWGRPDTTAAMMAVSAACALAIGLAAEVSAALVLSWGSSGASRSSPTPRSSRRSSRSWPSRRMSGPPSGSRWQSGSRSPCRRSGCCRFSRTRSAGAGPSCSWCRARCSGSSRCCDCGAFGSGSLRQGAPRLLPTAIVVTRNARKARFVLNV